VNFNVVSQIVLIIIISWVLYQFIEIIRNSFKRRKFVIKTYINQGNTSPSLLDNFSSLEKYKEHLKAELEEANYDISVERFTFQRIFLAICTLISFVLLYFMSDEKLFLYTAIPVVYLSYRRPKKILQKKKELYQFKLRNELFDFLYHFAVLLESHEPKVATHMSEEYAGPLLKPHVQNLLTQMNLYKSSSIPFNKFAEDVKLREAKEFMIALQQIMKIGKAESRTIIQDQIQIMKELQEESYNEQIEERPEKVDFLSKLMLVPFFIIIMACIFVSFLQLNP